MFRSVRNAAVDIMRRRRRSVALSAADLFEAPAPSGGAFDNRRRLDQAAQGLSKLSERERETVLQHLVAGLSFRQIAEVQDCPIGTVTSWYHRGLTKLRASMRA
jgi:RNA polymerase sigma-70 factor (ECF subfamily)